MIGMSIKRISVLNLCHVLKPFVKSTPELQFIKAISTEPRKGHFLSFFILYAQVINLF